MRVKLKKRYLSYLSGMTVWFRQETAEKLIADGFAEKPKADKVEKPAQGTVQKS